MSYQLRADEALADGLRRICRDEICKAIGVAEGSKQSSDTPVHQTRKHLKKARAVLRLVRKEIGHAMYRHQDHRLRDAARLVSEVRDAEVRLETVKQLGSIKPTRNRALYGRLEELLTLELESFLAAFAEWQGQIIPMLQQARDLIDDWPVHEFAGHQLIRAVQASYKRARRQLNEIRKNPTPECFHEFRAKAKLLGHQLRMLRPIQPVVLKKLDQELDTVTDLLGRAHDLMFLGERLREGSGGVTSQRDGHKLVAVIEISENDLQRAAGDLAERFFAERPRDFGQRLDTWFNEWTAKRPASVAEALLT